MQIGYKFSNLVPITEILENYNFCLGNHTLKKSRLKYVNRQYDALTSSLHMRIQCGIQIEI